MVYTDLCKQKNITNKVSHINIINFQQKSNFSYKIKLINAAYCNFFLDKMKHDVSYNIFYKESVQFI